MQKLANYIFYMFSARIEHSAPNAGHGTVNIVTPSLSICYLRLNKILCDNYVFIIC